MNVDIRKIDQRWQVATSQAKDKHDSSRNKMYLKDYKMDKRNGYVTQVLLTRDWGEAMKFTSESFAEELAKKTDLKVYYIPTY